MNSKLDSLVTRLRSFREIVDKYDSFIFDCDGTLWSGNSKFDEAFQTLHYLKSLKKKILFLTNATHKKRDLYKEKLTKFGFDTPLDTVYNASYLSAAYLRNEYPNMKKIYVVGMKALVEDPEEFGFTVIGGPDHSHKEIQNDEDFINLPVEDGIEAVLLGFDFSFNYYKLAYASVCLQKGAKLFASNSDSFDNIGEYNLPRAGCSLAALEKASQKKALIIGKPNPFGMKVLQKAHDLDLSRTLMVGDNLETDILFGINCGIDTLVVYTGVTNEKSMEEEIEKENRILPKYVCNSL